MPDLRAFYVSDGESAVVVFHQHGAAARRVGASELFTDFDCIESCRREPAFDKFAPGPVPIEAKLEAGWWFECPCGERAYAPDAVFDGNNVWCSARCPELLPAPVSAEAGKDSANG